MASPAAAIGNSQGISPSRDEIPNLRDGGETADASKDASTDFNGRSFGLTIAACSNLFLIQRAQDALGPNQEDDDQNGEGDCVPICERDVAAAENFRHAKRYAAKTGAEH